MKTKKIDIRIISIISQIVSQFFSLILTLFILKHFGSNWNGYYLIVTSYSFLLQLFESGIIAVASYKILNSYKVDSKVIFAKVVYNIKQQFKRLNFTILIFIFLLSFIFMLKEADAGLIIQLRYIFIFSVLLSSLSFIWTGHLMGFAYINNDMQIEIFFTLFENFIKVIWLILTIFVFKNITFFYWVLVQSAMIIISRLLYGVYLRKRYQKYFPKIEVKLKEKQNFFFSSSKPILFSKINFMLGLPLLSIFFSDEIVSNYGWSKLLISFPILIIFRSWYNEEKILIAKSRLVSIRKMIFQFQKTIYHFNIICTYAFFPIILFFNLILHKVLLVKFDLNIWVVFWIIIQAYTESLLLTQLDIILILKEKNKYGTTLFFILLLLNIIISIIFFKLFGWMGGIIASAMSEVLIYAIHRKINVPFSKKELFSTIGLLATSLLATIIEKKYSLLIDNYSLISIIIIDTIIYIGYILFIYFVFKYNKKEFTQ